MNRYLVGTIAFVSAASLLWGGCIIGPTSGSSSSDAGDSGDAADSGDEDAGACDVIIEWSRNGEFDCTECTRMNCASEQVLLDQAQTTCPEEMQAALACNTCGCGRNALAQQADCASALETYLACKVEKCEAYCK